jgi:hypothetical protein
LRKFIAKVSALYCYLYAFTFTGKKDQSAAIALHTFIADQQRLDAETIPQIRHLKNWMASR